MTGNPVEVYRTAVERVPAYRSFLETQCGTLPELSGMDDFARLPCMDKGSYIQAYPLAERCLDGTLHGKHVIMHSSGSSGKHTYWPCLPEQEKAYWKAVYQELDANYGISRKPTLLILGVLMGGNMSGALFAYALRAIGIETGCTTLVTPGRDEDACVETIASFSSSFEQTILYSYPATAKNILEKAAQRGLPLEQYGIRLRLLGEGYSEMFRDQINKLLSYPFGALDTINSGYGATDFRSAGRESLLCIAIKRLLYEQNRTQEILGVDQIPTICQYDPEQIYIESIEGELVMTRHNAVPLIRYRSGDTGMLMTCDEMLQKMADHGLDPLALLEERGANRAAITRQPFIMVHGRKDGGITFYGAKIDIAKIKAVLEETDELRSQLTGEFQVRKAEDDRLRPILELALVPRHDAGKIEGSVIASIFAEALAKMQGGIYADLLQKDREAALPRIRFVKREEIMTPSSFKIKYMA